MDHAHKHYVYTLHNARENEQNLQLLTADESPNVLHNNGLSDVVGLTDVVQRTRQDFKADIS